METRQVITDKHIGELLDDRFRVVAPLGEGGLSRVYRGIDQTTNQPVAIKILKSQFLSDKDAAGRFARETRACLSHQHLVQIIDRGIKVSGEPFIVMELLQGETLAEMLKRTGGKVGLWRAINLCRQTAEAIAVAHGEGIVHRDIKPSNIFLVSNGQVQTDFVKVLDFGVAKVIDQTNGFQTRSGETVGTPRFMSPEQITGERIDGRSDIYSLSVVLYEMVTGSTLFGGASPFEVMKMHVSEPPPDPRKLRPDLRLPADFCEALLRGLAKTPGQRFQTMKGFEGALRNIEENHPNRRRIDGLFEKVQNVLSSRKSADQREKPNDDRSDRGSTKGSTK